MGNEKLGQEAAFQDPARGAEQSISNQSPWANPSGMSKRFYAACAAMQGFISSGYEESADVIAEMAYLFADALLKQENE